MFIAAADITMSANADITTAAEGTKVRKIKKTTIDIPMNEAMIAKVA
jgi:hypothetical protein